LANAFYNLLDEWSRDQLMALPSPPSPEIFVYLMEACEQGLEVNESMIRSHTCTAFYNLCTFVIHQSEKQQTNPSQLRRRSSSTMAASLIAFAPSAASSNQLVLQQRGNGNETHWLIVYLNQYPRILPTIMASIFYLVLFEDNNDQWSLSRPLYTLIYLQRDVSTYMNRNH
jgi:exportin-7